MPIIEWNQPADPRELYQIPRIVPANATASAGTFLPPTGAPPPATVYGKAVAEAGQGSAEWWAIAACNASYAFPFRIQADAQPGPQWTLLAVASFAAFTELQATAGRDLIEDSQGNFIDGNHLPADASLKVRLLVTVYEVQTGNEVIPTFIVAPDSRGVSSTQYPRNAQDVRPMSNARYKIGTVTENDLDKDFEIRMTVDIHATASTIEPRSPHTPPSRQPVARASTYFDSPDTGGAKVFLFIF